MSTKATFSWSLQAGRIVRVAKFTFTPLAIISLTYVMWLTRNDISEILASANPGLLSISVVAWAASHLMIPRVSAWLLGAMGETVTWRQALSSHAQRLPAKYLPGGIWHTVGRAADLSSLSVPNGTIARFVALEQILALGVTATFGAAVIWITQSGALHPMVCLALAVGGITLILASPMLLSRVGTPVTVNWPIYCSSVLGTVLFWCITSVSFISYINAFAASTWHASSLQTAGIYLLSWSAGYVAVFAPQGIGVFEGVAAALAKETAPAWTTVALVAGFRVIVLGGDFFAWIISLSFRHSRG